MNKHLIVLLALALALVFVACAPAPTAVPTAAPPTTAPSTGATTAPTSAPAATTAPSAGTGKAVEIQFWHAQSQSQQKALDALVDKFNASHPDIKVVPTYQGTYSDIYKKITAAIAAGSPPDLAIGYQNDIANYIKSDAVIPLDDMMKDPKIGLTDADLKDIFPSFIDHYSQFGGKVYSMAFMRSMEVMFYNTDMVKAAGLSGPPQNWDDFMKVCAAANKPPDIYCYELSADASRFATWLWGRGGELLSPDGKTVAFDKQPGLDTLNWVKEMFDKKYSITQAKAFQDQTDFSLGKDTFAFGSTAGLPYYASAIKDAGKNIQWSIAPAPHTTPDPVVDLYGPSVTIFKTTPDKQQAAFVFLKYLMSPEANAEWVKATAYFPARQSTKDALADYIKTNPMYGQAFDWLKYGRTEPTVAAWNPIRGFIATMITEVANGKATPADALKTAAQKSNDALAAQ